MEGPTLSFLKFPVMDSCHGNSAVLLVETYCMRLIFSISCFALATLAVGQTGRTFLPVNPAEEKVQVVAGKTDTYVVKVHKGNSLEVRAFNQTMEEKWGIGLTVNFPLLHLAQSLDDILVLLMSDNKQQSFVLLEIDAETGHYYNATYDITTTFVPRKLARSRERFWLSGTIGAEPVAFSLDAPTGTFKALPVGHTAKVTDIAQLTYDELNDELDLLLETSANGSQCYVLRSIGRSGEVKRNQIFSYPPADIKDLQFRKSADGMVRALAASTKKSKDDITGIVVFNESDVSGRFYPLKDIPGVGEVYAEDGSSKQGKAPKSIKGTLESVAFLPEGGALISLETLVKDYEVRGLMQRESDQQSLIDQVDLNRYGRRDFQTNAAGDTPSFDDRAENFQNTEETTYRFREVIIDRVQEKGNRHTHSTVLRLVDGAFSGFQLKMPREVNSDFSIRNANLTFKGEETTLWVATKAGYLRWTAGMPEQKTVHRHNIAPFSIPVSGGEILNYGFILHEKVFYLMLQRFDFGQEIE